MIQQQEQSYENVPQNQIDKLIVDNKILDSQTLKNYRCFSASLKKFILWNTNIEPGGFRFLAGTSWPTLLHFSIRGCHFQDDQLQQLLQLKIPNLQALYLNQNELSYISFEILSRSSWSELRQIYLGNNNLQIDQNESCRWVKYLLTSNWKKMEKIELSNCGLVKKDLQQFKECLWDLTSLFLSCNNFGNKKDLFIDLHFKNLRNFDIQTCSINELDFQILFENFQFLEILSLQNNSLSPASLSSFLQLNTLNLQELNLGATQIMNFGMKCLNKISMPSLQKLILWDNSISGEGFRHFLKCKLPELKQIDFWCNNIGDDSLKIFHEIGWGKIKAISLWENKITDAGLLHLSLLKKSESERISTMTYNQLIKIGTREYLARILEHLDLSQ